MWFVTQKKTESCTDSVHIKVWTGIPFLIKSLLTVM